MTLYSVEDFINVITKYDTYFDTRAVLSEGFDLFLRKSSSLLKENGMKIFIGYAVINELKYMVDSYGKDLSNSANNCLTKLELAKELGIIEYVGDSTEELSVAQQYVSHVVRNRNKRKMIVVSNRPDLANDILLQNDLTSFRGNHTLVFSISSKGMFGNYEESESKQGGLD